MRDFWGFLRFHVQLLVGVVLVYGDGRPVLAKAVVGGDGLAVGDALYQPLHWRLHRLKTVLGNGDFARGKVYLEYFSVGLQRAYLVPSLLLAAAVPLHQHHFRSPLGGLLHSRLHYHWTEVHLLETRGSLLITSSSQVDPLVRLGGVDSAMEELLSGGGQQVGVAFDLEAGGLRSDLEVVGGRLGVLVPVGVLRVLRTSWNEA